MQSYTKFLEVLHWPIVMGTNAIVIYNVVSVVEVWCWVHRSNAYSINVQLIFQIINLLVDSCHTTFKQYHKQ